MNDTIFNITEKLPISVVIIPFDKKFGIAKGIIEMIVPDVKQYLIDNTDIDIKNDDINNIPDNTKGLSCILNGDHYLFNNCNMTLIVTISNLFVTCYMNGFKIEIQSNN